MQKWIRDRMRRRKKKTAEPNTTAEVTPPLQPVYPEIDAESSGAPEPSAATEAPTERNEETQVAAEPERTRPKRRRKKRPGTEPELPAAAGEVPNAEEAQPAEPLAQGAAVEVEAPVQDEPVIEQPTISVPTGVAATAPVPQKGRRPSKGAVVLAVGLPGSGKSTWFKRHNVVPLSSDMVRHLLFDNASEQRYQDLVFGTLRSLLRARLIAKMPMNYVDATNLSPKERRHWIRMAKDFGYDAHAVYFDVPMEVCMDRNRRRNRIVPEDVMHRMAAKLRPPTFDEGFAKIIVVRVKKSAEPAPVQESVG